MKWLESRVIWGILLIALGLIFLLQSFGFLGGLLALVWAFAFGAAGLAFLFVFLTNRAHWWAIIPGFALLSLAALIALDQLFPRLTDSLGGTLFLGGIGLGFWAVFLLNREHWWTAIPGGVLFTLALVAGLSPFLGGAATGGVFFVGLGLTFGLLSFLPTPQGRMKWALIPAAVMLVMGLLIMVAATPLLGTLWPAALILLGLYLVLRALGFRPSR